MHLDELFDELGIRSERGFDTDRFEDVFFATRIEAGMVSDVRLGTFGTHRQTRNRRVTAQSLSR